MSSVTQSCFFGKDSLSVGFVCRWLEKNIPNLIQPLHRFCVHILTTVYRQIESGAERRGIGIAHQPLAPSASKAEESVTMPFKSTNIDSNSMPLSQAWLLAASLPQCYTRPQISAPPRPPPESSEPPASPTVSVPNLLAPIEQAAAPNPHLASVIPMHWSLLYDSQQHGVGSNRFLHHVIGYKGPTLVILHSKSGEVFCVAAPSEWRETHLYIGGDECHIIQLLPKYFRAASPA